MCSSFGFSSTNVKQRFPCKFKINARVEMKGLAISIGLSSCVENHFIKRTDIKSPRCLWEHLGKYFTAQSSMEPSLLGCLNCLSSSNEINSFFAKQQTPRSFTVSTWMDKLEFKLASKENSRLAQLDVLSLSSVPCVNCIVKRSENQKLPLNTVSGLSAYFHLIHLKEGIP